MRTHREQPMLLCWRDPALLSEAVTVRTLCAARMEAVLPVGAVLDLTFSAGNRIAVVPFVHVRMEDLEQRENSPFVWPGIAQAVDENELSRIETLLLPWIESLTLARPFFGEVTRVFGDGDSSRFFESARRAGFLGAAPYERVLSGVAPYAYAARFAKDASIRIRDEAASLGTVILHRHAADVRADLGSQTLNESAARWYGADLFEAVTGPCDLSVCAQSAQPIVDSEVQIRLGETAGEHVVEVAQPILREIFVSFDPEDAAVVRRFSVRCGVATTPRSFGITPAVPVGGSSGRILLLLRDDWREADDSDSDDAQVLARMLLGEGFHVDVLPAAAAGDITNYDLVHAFGVVHAVQFLPRLRAARAAGIPVVLTPALADIAVEGVWGSRIVPILLQAVRDELETQEYLQILEQRRLEGDGISPRRQEPFAGYEQAVKEVLSLADAVIVSGPAEEALVSGMGCGTAAITAAPHLTLHEPVRVEHAVGTRQYVLIHAPVEPRNNQYLAARATMELGLPLVLAGPIRDVEYYHAICRLADELVVFLPRADLDLAQGLYRRASVYADFSWISNGLGRTASAGAAGCALAVSRDNYAAKLWAGQLWTADPASVDSIAKALDAAWRAAEGSRSRVDAAASRIAAWAAPQDAFRSTIRAYAQAQRARTPA